MGNKDALHPPKVEKFNGAKIVYYLNINLNVPETEGEILIIRNTYTVLLILGI